MGQHSAQSMNDGYPLYAFAFRSGLGRPRRDFTKADLATGNTDFVWVHLDLTPSEGMLKAGGLLLWQRLQASRRRAANNEERRASRRRGVTIGGCGACNHLYRTTIFLRASGVPHLAYTLIQTQTRTLGSKPVSPA